MEQACSSETMVMIYQATRRHIPENSNILRSVINSEEKSHPRDANGRSFGE
jgi:hypothetical protein